MSIAELKAEVDRLSPEEREHLAAYLKIRKQMQDKEFVKELSRKVDDNNPANWITLEEAEKRLFPKD